MAPCHSRESGENLPPYPPPIPSFPRRRESRPQDAANAAGEGTAVGAQPAPLAQSYSPYSATELSTSTLRFDSSLIVSNLRNVSMASTSLEVSVCP